MRFFFHWLFIVMLLFCACQRKEPKRYPFPKPVLPDKELKEIFIYGNYYPGDKKRKDPYFRKERFGYSGIQYCYNETKEDRKQPVFKEDLKARLYNREGELLTEDYLRIYGSIDSYSQVVSSYLPYDEEGHEIRTVRIIGKGREKPLWKTKARGHSYLIENSGVLEGPTRRAGRIGWLFDEKRECHLGQGPE